MVKIILIVSIGSLAGGVSRFLLDQYLHKYLPVYFPFGTLIINITGCFLIGIILTLSARGFITPQMRFLLATGFCGSYTTFSTFAYESISLLTDKEYLYMGIYAVVSLIIGLFATYVGIILARLI